jgi:hypothetical protein
MAVELVWSSIQGRSPVSVELGVDWVRDSLAQGSGMAELMTRQLGRFSSAVLLSPSATGAPPVTSLDHHGRGIRSSDADQIAERLLESFAAAGVLTLVVEDDMQRRGDPAVGLEVAFVGDRVVRWADLRVGAASAGHLLRASAYPLNAFACWASSAELGLKAGVSLSESQQAALVGSTCAVMTAVYDAETHLVLMSRDLEATLVAGVAADGITKVGRAFTP